MKYEEKEALKMFDNWEASGFSYGDIEKAADLLVYANYDTLQKYIFYIIQGLIESLQNGAAPFLIFPILSIIDSEQKYEGLKQRNIAIKKSASVSLTNAVKELLTEIDKHEAVDKEQLERIYKYWLH